VTDALRHLARRRDETRARIADSEHHPVEVTTRMRIAVLRFAQNGDLHTL
jgi:hypothetical protein